MGKNDKVTGLEDDTHGTKDGNEPTPPGSDVNIAAIRSASASTILQKTAEENEQHPLLDELIGDHPPQDPHIQHLITTQVQTQPHPHEFESISLVYNGSCMQDVPTTMVGNDNGEKYPSFNEFLEKVLSDSILVDLGGGVWNETMRSLAAEHSAKGYVNVDMHAFAGDSSITKPSKIYPDKSAAIGVKADMLDFVSHMKDDSASFTINGIDETILWYEEHEYNEALAKQILRATKIGGVIFGCVSGVLKKLKKLRTEGAKLEQYKVGSTKDFIFIFRKTG